MVDVERFIGILAGGAVAVVVSWLLILSAWGFLSRREEREAALDQLRNHPAKTIVRLLFVLSFAAASIFMVLAWMGFEPEIGASGWRFWTATGLATIALLGVSMLIGWS